MNFKNLHFQDSPLLICNVWDVASAKIAEKLDFKAIGTSSAAIANLLGYDDGEKMSFSELRYFVKRIVENTKLPLTVDLESGYSRDTSKIIENIIKLADLGVVGINIEDSIVNEERTLLNAECFSKVIYDIKRKLESENRDIFLNVRTDAFLLGYENAMDETEIRIKYFEEAGADCIFIPCIEKEDDIKRIIKSTNLPINVMCMPNLPEFEVLKKIGVNRISMGDFLFDYMFNEFEQVLRDVVSEQSFKVIF
ncbi:isocitrate lyase/PEP mutase family protein [Vibrio aestuarianus]|uniref:Isocitrate lyase/phosphoenolpyruvate mutase family protein n=1 Tax=Vibrio aestuarianus TaxID=28171 RepID=A0A9X4IV17_9VIBR|nr:isocitrate lyase/phosphoenolpyruvate mutase family protein [Vibrio aestuarianus]MDE1244169.1 isocitrate lyase/phosphoenolpyruvate mutase family protein [Vibrio aestuarianus]